MANVSITRLTVAVAVAFGVSMPIASAACPGVIRSTITSSSWETFLFADPATSSPQVVTFDVTSIGAGQLDVFASGAWTQVSAPGLVEGTRIRLSVSGTADVSYIIDECEEWLYTSDE